MKPEEAVETLESIIDYVKSHPFYVYYRWEEALRYAIHCCKVVERINVETINKIMQNCLKSGATTLDFAEAIVRELKGEE